MCVKSQAAKLIKDTLFLTCGDLILRTAGLCFQMYLAFKIGAQGLGIYGLITTVYTIFVTISVSGIRFCVTSLAAEELAAGNPYPRALVRAALRYAAVFSGVALCALFFLSSELSARFILHDYAALPLRISAVSLPFTALYAVLDGFFTARQKIRRGVLITLCARFLNMAAVAAAFSFVKSATAHPCDVLSVGTLIGEAAAFIFGVLFYAFDVFKKHDRKAPVNYTGRILCVSLPLAISAYMRTGLSSAGHMIIPYGLKKAGMGAGGALATYGIISQMAMPVIMFPVAMLSSLGDIVIPHVTYARTQKLKKEIAYICGRCIRTAFVFGCGAGAVMFFYGIYLGELFWKSTEAGLYIRLLSFIVPVVCCDCVVDFCLKGLGKQLYCMMINVLEAVINLCMLYLLLPRIAMVGYLITMLVKELFNAFFSLKKLCTVTVPDFDASIFFAAAAAIGAARMCARAFSFLPPLETAAFAAFYILLTGTLNKFVRADLRWLWGLFASGKASQANRKVRAN